MTAQDALARIGRRLVKMDETELSLGCQPITGQDLEIRLNYVVSGGWDMDALEVAGAHLVAWMLATDQAEEAQVHSGDEAHA